MGPVFVVITPLLIIVFAFLMSQIEKYFVLWGDETAPHEVEIKPETTEVELS